MLTDGTHALANDASPDEQNDADELLRGLTPEQQRAVLHKDGPLLVIAGAGSGKTRVLTRRVAQLLRSGVKPSSVLAITFTNKAAGEMKHRVADTVGRKVWDFGRLEQPSPMVCTFHSLCLRILKHYAPMVGLAANFLIYDSSDQNKVIKDALKTLEISSTNFSPATVHGRISNAKNQLITAEEFAKQASDFFDKTVARVYLKYQQMLNEASALDFDDLLLRTVFALRDHPQMLRELQERFRYILIDEYQDTNRAQYLLTHAMASKHRNICVVGDPDQSIYAWRGADLRNILDFERDYPDVTVVKLEQNYRSTKTILNLASKLIARNTQRKDKTLWTENPQGDAGKIVVCQDEHDESEVVAQMLRAMHDEKKIDWNKMAVFYRMNSLSRVVEDGLRKNGIPYQIARGVEFYQRKEIKDTLAYLKVIANPKDEVSLERIINTPTRGISDGTVQSLQTWGISNGAGLYDAMCRVEDVSELPDRAKKAVRKFVDQVQGWRQSGPCGPGATENAGADGALMFGATETGAGVKPLLEKVIRESGLEAMYLKVDPDREEQIPNIYELVTGAAEFDAGNPEGMLSEYLAAIALVSDADHMEGAGGAVTLMTLHAAKGLEFPVVAMVGLEEGILPHARARGNLNELEEERRLCFVGITRAQEHLMLTTSAYRTIRGLRERTVKSPFLGELPKESVEVVDRTSLDHEMGKSEVQIRGSTGGSAERFRKGQTVRHPSFGVGTIVEMSDAGSSGTRAVVDFRRFGRKNLILEYARLEPAS
jgi:DNA helicase-2/ATP-dependent DNA helicase PcrA